jgi:putative tryptophan/tyrosine transport system substrate-binding protein
MAINIARRKFIAALGGTALAWPLAARAQKSAEKVPRVGVLWHAGSAEEEQPYFGALQAGFRDLRYVEGQNIRLEHRFPGEQPDRFRTLAQELVESKVDAIVAVTALGAVELKKLTSTCRVLRTWLTGPIRSESARSKPIKLPPRRSEFRCGRPS